MSQENVGTLGAGSMPGITATSTSGLPLRPRSGVAYHRPVPDRGVYRGRQGLQRYWAEIREDVEEISLSISDLRATGDKVFLALTGKGQGKRSKVPVQRPIWFVMTLRGGLAVRVETYTGPKEALEAAGLSE